MSEAETAIELVDEREGVQQWAARHEGRLLHLEMVNGDGPFVWDEDLGGLGLYARPRDIRALVKRMVRTGKFKDSELRGAPPQMRHRLGRPAAGYLLTRAQALYVITQSRAPNATSLQRCFLAMLDALEGTLKAKRTQPSIIENPTAVLTPREELALVRARLRQVAAYDRAVKRHRAVRELSPVEYAKAERFRAKLVIGTDLPLPELEVEPSVAQPVLPEPAPEPPVTLGSVVRSARETMASVRDRAEVAHQSANPPPPRVERYELPTVPIKPPIQNANDFAFDRPESRVIEVKCAACGHGDEIEFDEDKGTAVCRRCERLKHAPLPPARPAAQGTWPPSGDGLLPWMKATEIAMHIGYGCSPFYVGTVANRLGLKNNPGMSRPYVGTRPGDPEGRKFENHEYTSEAVRVLIAWIVAHPSRTMRTALRRSQRRYAETPAPAESAAKTDPFGPN